MIESVGGSIAGRDLALNKKFKIPIICGWIFSIILLIMSFSAFLDYNNFTILEKENIIVKAITYPATRTSLDNYRYDTKYYEWSYHGKYYSAKIPSYDGFTQEEPMGNSYDIYINSQNPLQFARVENNNSLKASIGCLGIGIFFLTITTFLIYMQKKANKESVLKEKHAVKNNTISKELEEQLRKHKKDVNIIGNVIGGIALIYMLVEGSVLSVIISLLVIAVFVVIYSIRYKKILKKINDQR